MTSTSNEAQGELGLRGGRQSKDMKYLEKHYFYSCRRHGIDLLSPEDKAAIFHNVHSNIYSFMYNIGPKEVGWRDFTMLRQSEMERITLLIDKCRYPRPTMKLWMICMANAEMGTGQVLLDREELAEKTSVRPEQVSRSMKILHELDAVWSKRVKGRMRYRCNGLVGWAGDTKEGIQLKARQIEEGVKRAVREALNEPGMPV